MTYRNNVEAAASALSTGEDANWELARLTYENTRGKGGQEQLGKVTMEQWCSDVRTESGRKFSTTTGEFYRGIWSRYGSLPVGDRPNWTEAMHRVIGRTPESHASARIDSAVRTASPEKKREIFQRLAQDEDVLEEKEQVLTTLLQDPLIQQKIKHNPDAIPGIEDAVVDIASNSPRTAARVNVRYEEKHERTPEPNNPSNFEFIALLGTGAAASVKAKQFEADIRRLIDGYMADIHSDDLAVVRANVARLHHVADRYRQMANDLAESIGDPINEWEVQSSTSWIDEIERNLSRMERQA